MGKRIASMIAVVILIALFVMTMVFACIKTPGAQAAFRACLVLLVFVPIVFWLFLRMYTRAHENDDKAVSAAEMRKINKRIKKGEDPDRIAEELKEKYNLKEDK